MNIKPIAILSYFPSASSLGEQEQSTPQKPANNIVPTHGFVSQSEPSECLWLLY
jgi:hypothetical protein